MSSTPPHVSKHKATFALQRKGLIDVSTRLKNGAFIYAALWVAACQAGDFADRFPGVVWWNALFLLLFGLVRLGLHLVLPRVTERASWVRLRTAFRFVTSLHAFYFGALTAWVLVWPEAKDVAAYAVVIAATMTIGGTMIVAIEPMLAIAYPVALITPIITGLLIFYTPSNGVLAALGGIFALYCVRVARALGHDYWLGQRSRLLLEERARQLEVLSLTDTLTQIPNRLYFERRLAMEWASARRAHLPLSVAIIDLDHFKSINDTHGHPFGDECLKATANALQSELLRTTDEVARYGGEEFIVLLPQVSLEGAVAVAQRLLESVHEVVVTSGSASTRMSCSIGVACTIPAQPGSADALIKAADRALYEAKQQGRNRVVAHEAHRSSGPAGTSSPRA